MFTSLELQSKPRDTTVIIFTLFLTLLFASYNPMIFSFAGKLHNGIPADFSSLSFEVIVSRFKLQIRVFVCSFGFCAL